MKDFELTLRLRNNQLKSRRLALGLTHRKLAELAGISHQAYMQLETMHRSPLCGSGAWRKISRRLAEFYKVTPEELFPNAVLAVTKPVVVRELDTSEIVDLLCLDAPESDPELLLEKQEELEDLHEAICKLPENQQVVMRMRMSGDTLEEIGQVLGKNRETVRQAEASAIRTVREYSRQRLRHKVEMSPEQMRVLELLPDPPRVVYIEDERVRKTLRSLPESLIVTSHQGLRTGYSRSALGSIIAARAYPVRTLRLLPRRER